MKLTLDTERNAGLLAGLLGKVVKKKENEREFTLYVAFSVHGSHAFLTAVKKVKIFVPESMDPSLDAGLRNELAKLAKEGFTRVNSRRPDYNSNVEMKLHWDKLTTKEGKPLRSVPIILQRFKELEALGFSINKESFVKKHYH